MGPFYFKPTPNLKLNNKKLNKSEIKAKTIISKDNIQSVGGYPSFRGFHSACYIITFNDLKDDNFYYIGSSTNIAQRVRQLKYNFNKFEGSLSSNFYYNPYLI
jgi:hypothetical protein